MVSLRWSDVKVKGEKGKLKSVVSATRVRDLFEQAKKSAPCIIFIDEIDAVGRQRGAGLGGGHDEREQTLNQLLVEMDGFSANEGVIVLAATNRPDVLDPALIRPGRIDRKIEYSLPDLEGRVQIFKIHARTMAVEKDTRFELLARLTNNCTGADIRSVCIEAGMFAIRGRRKTINEKDLLDSIEKVIKGYSKFSANKKYLIFN